MRLPELRTRHGARRALPLVFVACVSLAVVSCGSGLKGKTVDDRVRAAAKLAINGSDENIPILLEAAKTDAEMVQVESITALGRIGTPKAVAALAELSSTDSRILKLAIAQALSDVAPTSYPQAAEVLVKMGKAALPKGPANDPGRDVRRAVTTSLAIVKQPAGLEFLLGRALADTDENTRNAAVKTLGRLKDPRPVEGLAKIYREDNDKNRAWAIEALGEIGDPRAVPVVMEALDNPDKTTRGKAAWALMQLQQKDAIPALKAALQREENEMPAVVISHALATLGETSAVENLEHFVIYARSEFARAEAGRALAKVGRCESLPVVDRAFREDRDGLVKREAGLAALALLERCPPEVVKKLQGEPKK